MKHLILDYKIKTLDPCKTSSDLNRRRDCMTFWTEFDRNYICSVGILLKILYSGLKLANQRVYALDIGTVDGHN